MGQAGSHGQPPIQATSSSPSTAAIGAGGGEPADGAVRSATALHEAASLSAQESPEEQRPQEEEQPGEGGEGLGKMPEDPQALRQEQIDKYVHYLQCMQLSPNFRIVAYGSGRSKPGTLGPADLETVAEALV